MAVAQLYLFRTLQRTLPVRKATLFAHACKLRLEGIVSKRKDWFKFKNPAAPAVKRGKIGAKRNGDDGGWQK